MKYTTNYNLKKPEESDNVDIADINLNADTIDTELKAHADTMATKEDTANKGVANGYAELDETGKVPTTQLPEIPAEGIASINGVTSPGGNIDIVAGTGVTVTPDATNKKVTITATGSATPGAHAETHATGGADPITPASIGIDNAIYLDLFKKQETDLDDTERLQRAIDYCSFVNQPLVLNGGVYTVVNLTIPPGSTIIGNGAIFKKPNLTLPPYNKTVAQMKWIRMMSLLYTGNIDSSVTTISGITFDGNCWEMWETPSYDQEQASLLFCAGESTSAGRLIVNIENCRFMNNVSDGIHIYTNVVANIKNCSSYDCFRGGLTITGGNSDINVNNFVFQSNLLNDGIDMEVDAAGYNNNFTCNATFSNIVIDKDLDISVAIGSTVCLDNIKMKGATWVLGSRGVLLINNSDLIASPTTRALVQGSGQIFINNTLLRGTGATEGYSFPIQFYLTEEGSRVELNNCTFKDCKFGIGGNQSAYTKVFVNACKFGDECDLAIGQKMDTIHFAPKQLHISNCIFDNYGYFLQNLSTYTPYTKIYLNANNVVNPSNKGMYLAKSEVYFIGENIFEYGEKVTFATGTSASKWFGARVLITDNDPTNTEYYGALKLFGHKGDIVLLRNKSRKWEYGIYLNTPGSYYHVWDEVTAGDYTQINSTGRRPKNAAVGTSYYDTTLNKPIWCSTAGTREVDTLTITSGATASGNITLTLDGVATNVAVTAGDTVEAVADKIRATTYSKWLTGGTSGTVIFTHTIAGACSAPVLSDTGATGVTATFVVTTAGTANVWIDAAGGVV